MQELRWMLDGASKADDEHPVSPLPPLAEFLCAKPPPWSAASFAAHGRERARSAAVLASAAPLAEPAPAPSAADAIAPRASASAGSAVRRNDSSSSSSSRSSSSSSSSSNQPKRAGTAPLALEHSKRHRSSPAASGASEAVMSLLGGGLAAQGPQWAQRQPPEPPPVPTAQKQQQQQQQQQQQKQNSAAGAPPLPSPPTAPAPSSSSSSSSSAAAAAAAAACAAPAPRAAWPPPSLVPILHPPAPCASGAAGGAAAGAPLVSRLSAAQHATYLAMRPLHTEQALTGRLLLSAEDAARFGALAGAVAQEQAAFDEEVRAAVRSQQQQQQPPPQSPAPRPPLQHLCPGTASFMQHWLAARRARLLRTHPQMLRSYDSASVAALGRGPGWAEGRAEEDGPVVCARVGGVTEEREAAAAAAATARVLRLPRPQDLPRELPRDVPPLREPEEGEEEGEEEEEGGEGGGAGAAAGGCDAALSVGTLAALCEMLGQDAAQEWAVPFRVRGGGGGDALVVHVDEPLPAVHMSLRDKNALFCASAVREALAQAPALAAAAEQGSQRRSALLDMGRGGGAGEDAGARLRLRVRWQPDGVVADGERRPRAVSLRAKLEYWPEHGEEQETPGDAAWSWASALLQPDALAVTARVAVCSGQLIGLRCGAAAEAAAAAAAAAAAPPAPPPQQQQQQQQQQCVDRVHGLLRYMRTLPAGAYLAKRAEGAPRVVIFRDVAGAVCASGAEQAAHAVAGRGMVGEELDLHAASALMGTGAPDAARSFVPLRWAVPERAPRTFRVASFCHAFAVDGKCATFDTAECKLLHVRQAQHAQKEYTLVQLHVDANTGGTTVLRDQFRFNPPNKGCAGWSGVQLLEAVSQQAQKRVDSGKGSALPGAVGNKGRHGKGRKPRATKRAMR
jgi:hypothetical protein